MQVAETACPTANTYASLQIGEDDWQEVEIDHEGLSLRFHIVLPAPFDVSHAGIEDGENKINYLRAQEKGIIEIKKPRHELFQGQSELQHTSPPGDLYSQSRHTK